MKKVKTRMKLISTFLSMMAVASCGSKHHSTDVKSQNLVSEPILVVAGGFGSCENEGIQDSIVRASKTSQMLEGAEEHGLIGKIIDKYGTRPTIFASCYGGPSGLTDLNRLTNIMQGKYYWQGYKGYSKSVHDFSVPQGESLKNISFLAGMKLELLHYVRKLKSKNKQPVMYFVGHSYGGFTVMQLASTFSKYVRGIVTVDVGLQHLWERLGYLLVNNSCF